MHGRTSVLAVLPLPRHRELAAADLAASHRALVASIFPIESVRAHASAISTVALAVFRALHARPGGPPADRAGRARAAWSPQVAPGRSFPCSGKIHKVYIL